MISDDIKKGLVSRYWYKKCHKQRQFHVQHNT
jgi:hypothetical protein